MSTRHEARSQHRAHIRYVRTDLNAKLSTLCGTGLEAAHLSFLRDRFAAVALLALPAAPPHVISASASTAKRGRLIT
eukprot:3429432-Rhodomonas_salina.2